MGVPTAPGVRAGLVGPPLEGRPDQVLPKPGPSGRLKQVEVWFVTNSTSGVAVSLRTSPGNLGGGPGACKAHVAWCPLMVSHFLGPASLAFFFFGSPRSSNHRAFVHAVHTVGSLSSLSFTPTQAFLTASSSGVSQWKVLGEDGWAGGEVRYFSPLLPSLHLGRELHPPQLNSHPVSPLTSSP